MLIAKLSNGTLILGLSRENISRLMDGKPIRITEESHGVKMPEGTSTIGIVFGETEEQLKLDLQAAGNVQ